jgi:hypothetical protein
MLTLIFLPIMAIISIIKRKNTIVEVEDLIMGFFLLIISLTFISLIIPAKLGNTNQIAYSFIAISSLLILANFKKITGFKKWEILSGLFLFFLYWLFSLYELKFHASPDNHGIASAIGYFSKNLSYTQLKDEFLLIAKLPSLSNFGYPSEEFLKKGYKFNIDTTNVYTIGNSQLRWTVDLVITNGRIGMALLGSLVNSISDPLKNFLFYIPFMGIIGSYFFAILVIEIFKVTYLAMSNKHIETNNIYGFSIALIISLSNWLVIMVTEGSINQLWLIISAQFHVLQLIKYYTNKKSQNLIYLFVGPIFMSIIYPHGFLFLIAISLPIIFLILFSNSSRTKKFFAILSTISFIPFTLILLRGKALFSSISMFLHGIAGSSYDLGPAKLVQFIYGMPYTWLPLGHANGFGYSIENESISSLWKYTLILLVIIFLIFIVQAILVQKNNRKNMYLFMSIPSLLLSLIVLMVFKSKINPSLFQSWIHLRHNINFMAIGFPILLSSLISLNSINSALNNIKNIRNIKIFFRFIVIAILINTSINFYIFSKDFNRNSRPFNIIKNEIDYKKINPKESILVTQIPDHNVFSLGLLGPVNYITDTWGPVFKKEYFKDNIIDVYEVKKENNLINFKKIGTLSMDKDLTGPITSLEIKKIKGFNIE